MAGRRHSPNACGPRRPTASRSSRAELQFPVSRLDRLLREGRYAQRLSSLTPVFLAGVLEYLTANILELASREARSQGRSRIAPEHLETVVDSNQHFRSFFQDDVKSLVVDKTEPDE